MSRRPSLTLRLALLFAAVSTAVLLGIGGVIGYLVEEHFEMLDLADLHGKLMQIQHILAKTGARPAAEDLRRRLNDAVMDHHGLAVEVLSDDGATVFRLGETNFPPQLLQLRNEDLAAALARPLTWEDQGRGYRGIALSAAAGPGLPRYTIAVALDLAHHQEFMAAFRRILWAALALGAASSILLGWFAARRGLAPIRDIASAARGISAERLDARLPTAAVPIEMQDLVLSFNQMLAGLEASFKRLSEFSSDIAHELRTPVSNLMTQTQVAVSKARSSDEYREILYSNLEEYDRLARMIADMLFIAKADNQLLTTRSQSVDIGAEVERLIDFYQALADEQGVRLVHSGSARLTGDPLMLGRALSNLLSNAIRHTPRGGTVAVTVATTEQNEADICVENSGESIALEHLPRLFDRFYRVDPARARASEGAGLGLAIVKSIVEAHAGKLAVRSNAGLTAFVMSLPLTLSTSEKQH